MTITIPTWLIYSIYIIAVIAAFVVLVVVSVLSYIGMRFVKSWYGNEWWE